MDLICLICTIVVGNYYWYMGINWLLLWSWVGSTKEWKSPYKITAMCVSVSACTRSCVPEKQLTHFCSVNTHFLFSKNLSVSFPPKSFTFITRAPVAFVGLEGCWKEFCGELHPGASVFWIRPGDGSVPPQAGPRIRPPGHYSGHPRLGLVLSGAYT